MDIDVNGVKITLTASQLEEITRQTKKNKPITERIQTFQDVLNELGEYNWKVPYPDAYNKEQKYVNACAKLAKIIKAYNEGVELDFKNSNQKKYYVYKYWSHGSWLVNFTWYYYDLDCSAFGYYKSEELSKDAYNKFKDVYEDYWAI